MSAEHTDNQSAFRLIRLGVEVDLTAFKCRILVLALGDSSLENRQKRLLLRKHGVRRSRTVSDYPVLQMASP